MRRDPEYTWSYSTVIEPLVNNWPAWSYLISPAPASLHLANFQIETMRSYLNDPETHVKACKNPDLIGGPFINIPPDRAPEVDQLLSDTQRKQKHNLEFARALIDFHNMLNNEAKGESLESYYRKLPTRLRGYVELVYDYNNHPILRIMESLLYESEYYDTSLQSLRISSLASDSSRPFFMSTPCLLDEGQIDWLKPFDDSQAEDLFRLDSQPQLLGSIREIFGLSRTQEQRVARMLMPDPAPLPEKWNGQTVRIRYFGHACVLVEWKGISVLTDPFVSAMPDSGGIDRLTYRDLPAKIDVVLITHNHCDHFVLETLLRLRHRIELLVVPRSFGLLHGDVSLMLMSRKLGFKNVVELDALEKVEAGDVGVIAIPFMGEHGDLAHAKSAYVVCAGGQKIMFAADSNCLDKHMYELVHDCLGAIETVFIGTESVGAPLSWSYGALFPKMPSHHINQSRKQCGCDSEGALDILKAVGARRVYNYGMGQEPWLERVLALSLGEDSPQIQESNLLLAKARAMGFLAAERLFGKREFYLEADQFDRNAEIYDTVSSNSCGASDSDNIDDAADQFVF